MLQVRMQPQKSHGITSSLLCSDRYRALLRFRRREDRSCPLDTGSTTELIRRVSVKLIYTGVALFRKYSCVHSHSHHLPLSL